MQGKKRTTEEFIEEAKIRHGDRYDYSLVDYKRKDKHIKIICKKHGVFKQAPNSHLKYNGCKKCSQKGRKKGGFDTIEIFIEKAKKVHESRYDYSLAEYVDSKTQVSIICKKHGVFSQTPCIHLAGSGCDRCGRESHIEKISGDTEKFIKEATEIYGDEYGYQDVIYVKADKHVVIHCKKHGEFKQTPSIFKRGRGCSKCAREDYFKEVIIKNAKLFLEKAPSVHGNKYDYSKVVYVKGNEYVTITCKEHGDFPQTPSSHLAGSGCPICGNNKRKQNIRREPHPLKDLIQSIRVNIARAFNRRKYTKRARTYEILGCTYEEFKIHLEDNPYGFTTDQKGLDLDHIIPLSSAITERDVYLLNHYTNFQLLPKEYNRHVKRAKTFNEDCLNEWIKRS